MKLVKIILWATAIFLMFTIFSFSSQPASESNDLSESITEIIINSSPDYKNLEPEKKKADFAKLNDAIRNYAHFTLYLLLSMSLLGALKFCYPGKSFIYILLITILICILYAVSDEFHQLFVPGRGCQWQDVLTDTGGSIIGTAIVTLIIKIKQICNKG